MPDRPDLPAAAHRLFDWLARRPEWGGFVGRRVVRAMHRAALDRLDAGGARLRGLFAPAGFADGVAALRAVCRADAPRHVARGVRLVARVDRRVDAVCDWLLARPAEALAAAGGEG